LAAVISVLAALRNHPDKQQLLIYDSFYPLNNNNSSADTLTKMMSPSPTANPEKNYLVPLQFYQHREILKIAEEIYDRFLKVAVDNTISHSVT
jgi:hypothetical protein